LVLAVDLGTSGCKSALVTLDGDVLAWSFRPVPLYVNGVAAEQDPNDWWSAFVDAATNVLSQEPSLRQNVVAVCCSAQGEGTVAVDRAGLPLGRAILWLDMRGAESIARRVGGRWLNLEGYSPAKLWKWLRLTGGVPALSGKDSAGHISYIHDQDPARYERTYKFLNVLDYMNLRLTGRFCSTHDSIVTTWVTDNRDPADVRYNRSLLLDLGICAEKLPELVPCTEVLGPLLPEVSEKLGLPAGTGVVAGAIDNSAVAVGAGTVDDFAPHLYLGTSSWVGAHVPFKKTDVRNKIASIPCAVPSRFLAMAIQSAGGVNLSFLRDRILFHPDALMRDEQRPDLYRILDEIAQGVPAGARGLIYTPWLFGERSPIEDSTLRAGLFNLSLEHSREDIIRAFLEGVGLNIRWMLEPFVRFIGRRPDLITAVGGGAQSDVWCQIIADATGVRIRQPGAAIQANALGAAFIAGVGIGELTFSELPALHKTRRVYEPNPAHRELYDQSFGNFTELYRRLAPMYRRINKGRRTPR
jgi:xylulokinase